MSVLQEKRIILILAGFFLLGIISFYSIKMYRRMYHPTKKVFIDQVWRNVQKEAKNTVLQIFADVAYFNWVEPFKSPEEDRNYGSGFFIDDKGHIVTNFHVVDEATGIGAQIPVLGKERLNLEVVGVCPQVDLALLKLSDESFNRLNKELGKIKYLEFGDSDKIFRTQEILALGYQLGQEKLKSSKGIISGRERLLGESYVQMTAPVNRGNSGGPSLDSEGKVIGINTAAISEAENVGYIIPANDIKSVIEKLKKTRLLRRPKLGGEFNISTKEMVEYLKNPEPGGVYINKVLKGSMMERAGIRPGDMLYKINGYMVDRFGEVKVPWSEDIVNLGDVINRFKLGSKVEIEVARKGKIISTNLDFDLIDLLPIRSIYPEYEPVDYEIFAGMVVMELRLNHIPIFKDFNPYLINYVKKENQNESKLLMTYVFPGSQTKKARSIFAGDIIEEVNGEKIKTLKDFRTAILKSKKNRYFTVKSSKKRFMVLSLDKILRDEDRLFKTYLYKKSKLCDELKRAKKIPPA